MNTKKNQNSNKLESLAVVGDLESQKVLENLKSSQSINIELAMAGKEMIYTQMKYSKEKNEFYITDHRLTDDYSTKPVGIAFVDDLSKYLVKAQLVKNESSKWKLFLEGEMFLVQRRENFRVKVSEKIVKNSFVILRSTKNKIECQILNLSLSGCLLLFEKDADVKLSDLIIVNLELEDHTILKLEGEIVRKGIDSTVLTKEQQWGVHFSTEVKKNEKILRDVIMKCYRLTQSIARLI